MASTDSPQTLFTCISCAIAFLTPDEQRLHYRSDHHRYNMKRRVAGLPPISVTLFNERVLERKAETAITTTPKSMTCEVCNKVFSTENTYKSHMQSKKHKERELQGPAVRAPNPEVQSPKPETESQEPAAGTEESPAPAAAASDEPMDEDAEIERTIEEKIAAARARLRTSDCLFCPLSSPTFEENLTHMSLAHSFFIPDADYLVDLPGLIRYLGEKIAVGNVCIYCNEKSRGFRTLEAARKHMIDKAHCKLAYDTQNDKLELSDYYDFSSSYPDAALVRKKKSKSAKKNKVTVEEETEEWEDVDEEMDDGAEADEVVDIEEGESSEEEESDEDDLPDTQLTYGDSPYELVLASGARIGHRSMRRYYAQSFTTVLKGGKDDVDPNSGAGLVRKLLAEKNSALVPSKGGFGAFGAGTMTVKARNAGEAREAGRHVKEFRDMRRREEFKTKVGYRHNSQKHYRDPLLQ